MVSSLRKQFNLFLRNISVNIYVWFVPLKILILSQSSSFLDGLTYTYAQIINFQETVVFLSWFLCLLMLMWLSLTWWFCFSFPLLFQDLAAWLLSLFYQSCSVSTSSLTLWDPMDCSKPFYFLLSISHVFFAFLISNFLKFYWFQGARRCRGLYSLILNRKFSILVFRKQVLDNTLLNLW